MGVSASGSNLTFTMVRRISLTFVVVFVVLGYLYGPPASPPLHQAAIDQCNAHSGGNWRSYQLSWHVSLVPHWTCSNASRPQDRVKDLGWWTDPFSS